MTPSKRKNLRSRHSASLMSKAISQPSQKQMDYLISKLPTGWERLFYVRLSGSFAGLRIICPFCAIVPPKELRGSQRWRWMTVHVTNHTQGK